MMMRFDQISIRRKQIIAIMFAVVPALLLALAAFLIIEFREFRASAQRELYVLAEVLGESTAASIEFQFPKEAEQRLANLSVQKRIVDAAILDRNGAVFAVYNREGKTDIRLPESVRDQEFAFQEGGLWITRPVRHSGETLGTIYLRSDLKELNARLRWVLAGGFLLTLLIASSALFLAIRMGNVLSAPILHLADAARRIAHRKNLSERVIRESEDEIGELVDAFNGMLDQLGERQLRLEEAQRMTHLGNWAFNRVSRRFEWSEETYRIFGMDPAEEAPDMATFWNIVHPEDRQALDEVLQGVRGDNRHFEMDHRLLLQDGSVRWIHVSGVIYDKENDPTTMRGTVLDITERKQSEAALLQVQKLESLGVLAGGIAHDFNNLLGAMHGNQDLMRMAIQTGTPIEAYLSNLEGLTQKAADLTRQLLAYSGKGHFQLKPMDLSALVREMGHLLSVSVSKKAELHNELADNLPAIVGDSSQIQQVIMNLVINASEALGEREGFIHIRTCTEYLREENLLEDYPGQVLTPGQYVVLEVQDTGQGMDARTLERIFDPFFTTKFHGRGLGLAAMLGIVKGHKGGILVRSEVGKGSSFRLLFPASSVVVKETRPSDLNERYQGSGLVLVIDDEAEIRLAVCTMLDRIGFETIEASDGREGIELFQKHQADLRLVMLDLTMPHMDGVECLRELRKISNSTPVLLTSGFSEHEREEAFAELRLSGFIQKPYSIRTLMAKLREILG